MNFWELLFRLVLSSYQEMHIYIAPRLGLGFGLGLRFRLGFRGGRFFSWAAVPEPAEGGRPEVFCKKKSS